jgi:hypothetical protein
MKRCCLIAAVVIAISGMLRAETEADGNSAPAARLEARVEAATAKAAALAEAMKRLSEAGEKEREVILDALRRSFAEAGKVPRGITTVESRHEVRAIVDAGGSSLRQEKNPASTEVERLRKENRDLRAMLDELGKRLVEAEKRAAERNPPAWIDPPWSGGPPPGFTEYPPIPKIDGRVVGVSTKLPLLVISVGEEDGVKVGFEFTIYRGNTYVGKMVVEKVYPHQAVGRWIQEKTKDKILPGDSVTTKIS